MAKITYNITCREGIKQVTGYTFSKGELKFGVSNQSPATGNNITDWWVVTELTTGLSCAEGRTKKEAINNILTEKKLGIIKKYLQDNPHEDVNADIKIGIVYY